jgi:hypothetical protein
MVDSLIQTITGLIHTDGAALALFLSCSYYPEYRMYKCSHIVRVSGNAQAVITGYDLPQSVISFCLGSLGVTNMHFNKPFSVV